MLVFRQLFDRETSTYTYLLGDSESREAILIDPVLEQLERDLTLVRELDLKLVAALDTHVHADHVTALGSLRVRTDCATVLSERAGSGAAERLVKAGDRVEFGARFLEVRETPGHTSGCISFVLDDRSRVFTGDALLIRGCGRTDFQQGSARTLYASVHEQLFTLPDETLVYPGHDYQGRTCSSVGEEKRWNPRVGVDKTPSEMEAIMGALDLARPKQIDVAVPANLFAGLPPAVAVGAEPAPDRSWAPVELSMGGIPEVDVAWAAANPETHLVDVREADELVGELGCVARAEHAPLASLENAAAAWTPSDPLLLICRSGGRSGKAALALRARGFERVASVRGGMTEWRNRRLDVK